MKSLKSLPLLMFWLFSAYTLNAQDLIIKRNGDEIRAKIKEISATDVRYKQFDFQEGPDFVLPKTEIFMVKFENGIKQVFDEVPTRQAAKPQPTLVPDAVPVATPQQQLEGPRIGVTLVGPGKWADRLNDDYQAGPFISQFGWQFESRLFTTDGGTSGLVEWIPLIGGLEQGLFLPSLSALVGLRGSSGVEFGFGPNVSVAGAGLAIAAGITISTQDVNVPINFAVVPSRHGARFSLLTGFNIRKK